MAKPTTTYTPLQKSPTTFTKIAKVASSYTKVGKNATGFTKLSKNNTGYNRSSASTDTWYFNSTFLTLSDTVYRLNGYRTAEVPNLLSFKNATSYQGV